MRHLLIFLLVAAQAASFKAIAGHGEWSNEFHTDIMTDARRAHASVARDDVPLSPNDVLYETGTAHTAGATFGIMCLDGRLQIKAMNLAAGKLKTPRLLFRFDDEPHGELSFGGEQGFLTIGVLDAGSGEVAGYERLLAGLMGQHTRLLVRWNPEGMYSDVEFFMSGAAEAVAKAAEFGGCDLSAYGDGVLEGP